MGTAGAGLRDGHGSAEGQRASSERREPVFDVGPDPVPASEPAEAPAPRRAKPPNGGSRPEAQAPQPQTRWRRRAMDRRTRRLLGRGRRPLARHRRHRRRGLGRRPSAADPVARNPQAPALDQDRRSAGPSARHPRRHGRRRGAAQGPAALRAAGLRRDRGPALLFALRHRSDRHRPRRRRQHPAPRRVAGRLDADPAARQEPVPDPGAHALPQGAGGGAGALAGAQVQQDADPRSLSQPRLLRRRRLRHRGGGAALLQQAGDEAHGGGGRDARRPRALAVAARADPQSGRRREARPDRARRHDRT